MLPMQALLLVSSIFADVGCQGRIGDDGVLRNSLIWKAPVNGSLGLPQPRLLPGSTDKSFDSSYINKPVCFYLQAVAKRVETLNVDNRTVHPQITFPPKQKCFLGIQTKWYQH